VSTAVKRGEKIAQAERLELGKNWKAIILFALHEPRRKNPAVSIVPERCIMYRMKNDGEMT
jgi:hypothetical protein